MFDSEGATMLLGFGLAVWKMLADQEKNGMESLVGKVDNE